MVFASDSWLGEMPASIALTSFSEAAFVANPKRVNRKSAAMASTSTSTIPDIQNRLIGIWIPESLKFHVGSVLGICLAAVPNHSNTVACSVSRMPSDATSFANGDAVRSGRNTSSSAITPTPIARPPQQ